MPAARVERQHVSPGRNLLVEDYLREVCRVADDPSLRHALVAIVRPLLKPHALSAGHIEDKSGFVHSNGNVRHCFIYRELRTGLGTVSAKALLAKAMNAAVAKRTPGPKRSQIQPPSKA